MRIAVPDLISNSYFPAAAMVELGYARERGVDLNLELIFPVSRAYEALRDGEIDFVAGSAHSALAAFPEWQGVKLLAAQGQGTYWFLVMRSDLAGERGDLSVVSGRKIGAAPWVEMALRQMLHDAGIDVEADRVDIAPVPAASGPTVNFGLAAAEALSNGLIDGFWANGMAAEIAVTSGVGKIVIDVRRGDGPPSAFDYTFASLATSDNVIERSPETVALVVQALVAAQAGLKKEPSLASKAGEKLFPEREAQHIENLVRRDLPLYNAGITRTSVSNLNKFCRNRSILSGNPAYEDVVAKQFSYLW